MEEYAPGELPDGSTGKQIVAACQRKCTERADCTHFVAWDNQACFTYATCLATTEGPTENVPSSEMLFVNTRRVQGKCDMIPVTSQWSLCAEEHGECEVADMWSWS